MRNITKCLSTAGILFLLISSGLFAQKNSYFSNTTPEEQSVSSTAVITFIDRIEQEVDAVHSFMIVRHGKLLSSGWWDPYGPEIPHVMHSLSKSFTSTAIGFAVDEGLLSLDDKVVSFFPEFVSTEKMQNMNLMRIRDLITMNTGHIIEPWPQKRENGSWVKSFLSTEPELKPGTHFKYNSMATYMLSAIIQKVSGEKLVDFLEPRLFVPLGIKKPHWDTCPDGINVGGWGLYIVTEDIAKLGQLYLQKGIWEGKQLLSEKWVEMAGSKQVSNGSDPDSDWEQGYGFQFWQSRHNCYRGDGAFGQYCIIMPDQDAVIAITAGADDMGRIMNIIWETLLPAMQNEDLPPNPVEFKKLEMKTSGLKLKPVEGEIDSPLSKKILKKTYIISDNNAGVKAITFKMTKSNKTIDFEMDHGKESIIVGSGDYISGDLISHLPYSPGLQEKIAAGGAWTKPNEYSLKIYFSKSTAHMIYRFTFQDDELKLEIQPKQVLWGPIIENLKGKLSDT